MLTVLFVRLKEVLASLNLFDSESKDSNIERIELLSTRIYIVLLSISFIILLTYTALAEQTSTITVKSPSQKFIEHLFDQYPESIHCPRTNVAIPYGTFTQMDVIYHQICSSPFINLDWIQSSYLANTSFIWPRDIRTLGSTHAQMLALFCSISQEQIDAALSTFKLSALITATVIEPSLLSAQVENQFSVINQTVAEQSKTKRSGLIVFMRGNQLASGLQTGSVWKLKQFNDNTLTVFSMTIWYQYDTLEGELGCYCDTITYCRVQAYFYPDVSYYPIADYGRATYEGTTDPISIDGWLANCYPIQSFLETNLKCYYNATCLNLLVDPSHTQTVPVLEMKFNETRFGRSGESNFLALINHLFVERFIKMVSFENFLQQCAPQFCTYTLTHKAGFLEIITTILGLFGGMRAALRIFVGQIIFRILHWKYQRSLKHNRQITDVENDSDQTKSK